MPLLDNAPGAGLKKNLAVALFLLILTAFFYWKVILSHQFSLLLGYEGANQAYAWFNFWVSTIRGGSWPVWDPFTFSGHAFAGEMQTGAFYPPYLMFLTVPFHKGVFSPQLFHVFFALTHAFCAWLMYLLARELGVSVFGGLVAGICFSLGGVLGRLNAWAHLLQSGIWLPLIALLLLRAMKSMTMRSAVAWSALSGLALAMSVLAGGLHFVIMQAIVAVALVVFFTSSTRNGTHDSTVGTSWVGSAAIVVVCGGFALAGGAVQIFVSSEYSHQAYRFLAGTALPATEKIPYNYLGDVVYPYGFLGLVLPGFTGVAGSGEYLSPYIGVFPVLLAAIGIWRQWATMWIRFLAGLVLAAFLYSMGSFFPLHGLLYAVTPLLWMAREANRFLYVADFALAILAAFGADAIFRSWPSAQLESANRVLRWIAIVCLAGLVYPITLGRDPGPWLSLSYVLVLLSCGLFVYITRGNHGRWARILTIAFVCFDLSAFDWSAVNKIEAGAKGQDEMARLLSSRDAAAFLRTRPGPFRVQVAANPAPNIGDVFGVQETWGAGVTVQMDYIRIKDHPDLLNARYVLRPATATEAGAIYQDAAWKVYENVNAYPRAWLVHRFAVEPDNTKVLARLGQSGLDFHQVALLNAAPTPGLIADGDTQGEQVRFHQLRPDRIELDASASGPALLVLSELFYPGWRAKIDGREAKILKVDGALRGVLIPPGKSHISMDYAPASFYWGLAFSISAFVCGGILGFDLIRNQMRRQAALRLTDPLSASSCPPLQPLR